MWLPTHGARPAVRCYLRHNNHWSSWRQRGYSSQPAIDRFLRRKHCSSGSADRERHLASWQLERHRLSDAFRCINWISQLQLSLSSSGTRTETQSGQGTDLACTWSGEDGIVHAIDPGNCWRPVIWFLPPLSLQPSLLPSYLGALDLGSGTVGFTTTSYRHLQGELVLPDLLGSLTSDIMQRSTADLGLDPASLLPAVLAYSIRPDNDAPIPIAIEIHYSNYRAINGVQIPFTIQRYINGSLQLEIDVTTAQVN